MVADRVASAPTVDGEASSIERVQAPDWRAGACDSWSPRSERRQVVEQPVEQRGGDDGIAEDLAPFGEAAVRG